jgi:hypothetical protein
VALGNLVWLGAIGTPSLREEAKGEMLVNAFKGSEKEDEVSD